MSFGGVKVGGVKYDVPGIPGLIAIPDIASYGYLQMFLL
jgi:hypothetical protein